MAEPARAAEADRPIAKALHCGSASLGIAIDRACAKAAGDDGLAIAASRDRTVAKLACVKCPAARSAGDPPASKARSCAALWVNPGIPKQP